MSIVTKVFFLFLASLLMMLFVSSKTESITQETFESLLTQKYIQVSDELFTLYANNDLDNLKKKLTVFKLEMRNEEMPESQIDKVIYMYDTGLSNIQVVKDKEGYLFLSLQYLDNEIVLKDTLQDVNFNEMSFLRYMIIADIAILIGLLLVILKMVYPLKAIAKAIQKFGTGEYAHRIEVDSKDEIADVAQTFNAMAKNLEELIVSRQRLLRDIGHELKTPISKSKLAAEMIEPSKYKTILQKALTHLDEMVDELLNIEKLHASKSVLVLEAFHVETLIGRALDKLLIEDETLVKIQIEDNFIMKADLNYLSIALKNLIDNALKYSEKRPIYIACKNNIIYVKSIGEKLDKPLEYYCDIFTQGDDSRGKKGYGLGLSIVKMIVQKHDFKLFYTYEEGYNIFAIKLF